MRYHAFLAPAFIALSALILVWDVFLAGQIAQLRKAPRPFRALAALAGLVVAPALVLEVASGSLLTARSVAYLTWLWPLALLLFTAQAAYATVRGLVAPIIGIPVVVYDALVAGAGLVRYAGALGLPEPASLLSLTAAQASTLGLVTGAAALTSPLAMQIPVLAPAYPARWRASKFLRAAIALVAAISAALTLVEIPPSVRAVGSYARYADERLQEHPTGDFAVGLRLFSNLDDLPTPGAMRGDLQLADTLDVGAVMLVLEPEGTRAATLDSLARSLDQLRRDSTLLIVALGYDADDGERYRRSPDAFVASRLADVRRVAQRLRPDYLLPADEPYGAGARAIGVLPPRTWESFLDKAAAAAHRVDRRIRVGVAAASYGAADSALYAWAAAPGSPVDVVGFTLFPSFRGGFALESRTRAADRWMRALPAPRKEQWVFAAGGYPAAHGERSQERAIWGALAWATSRPDVRGLVVTSAGDYESITGIRTPSGRYRVATRAVVRASRGLRESAGQ
ncbi:MAG: hypothetical protein ACJ79S_08295 [Gemmatimonadaceae bacterium]